MYETPDELARLQSLLDASYRDAGAHLRAIHEPHRRLAATEVVDLLKGVCVFDLATVNRNHEPFVAPVDGLFLGGRLWFGSSHKSLRFRHIRANPSVSAAHTRGEALSILVHGVAHEIDTASGGFERLHEYCREIYGAGYDNWGFWGVEPFAWIEPRRFYAIRMGSQP